MTQAELARGLNLSGAMVSKLKARGMPTDSLAAALAWREAHLDPCLVKSIRRPDQIARASRIATANALGLQVHKAIVGEAWGEFRRHLEVLREIFVTLTDAEQDRLKLPVAVWDALCNFEGPWSAHADPARLN